MNALDAAVAVFALSAFVGGWRLGFVQRLVSWAGMIGGILVGSLIIGRLGGSQPDAWTFIRAIAVLAIATAVGNVAGHWAGARLRSTYQDSAATIVDSLGGSLLGLGAAFLWAWMLLPAMTQIPGWPAETARSSVVAGRLATVLGSPPNLFDGISDALGLTAVFDRVPDIDIGDLQPNAPVQSPLDPAITEAAAHATVRIQSEACAMVSSGSGVVVLPGVVATNAHVVAGGSDFRLSNDEGLSQPAELRAIDPVADVAILVSETLTLDPLPLADTDPSGTGAIFGYPGGGALNVSPYQISGLRTVSSSDIYGVGNHDRSVVIVGSRIAPGTSGGPLVNTRGEVEAIAFGVAPDNPQLAYAISTDDIVNVLRTAGDAEVSSGACTR
ncbi:MAG: MarP family serine protease [Actinobacteria bacterium]|nr:MarP family serine protease [Actinomycetota bacterium]